MDIKELNNAIPADLKVKIKDFLSKFNTVAPMPVVQAAPVTPVAPTPVQMGEGMLNDGVTVIKYNTPTLQEGSVVTVVTPEGELAAPEGDHTLQDGTVITVAVENGVSTVKSVKAPEVAPAAPAAPEMAATVQAVQNQVTGFSEQLKNFASEKQEFASKIESQGKLIEAQKAEIESLKSNVSEFITLFASVLEIPSAQPTEKPRNKFSPSVEQKINSLNKFKIKN
jgi:hypothetical protein